MLPFALEAQQHTGFPAEFFLAINLNEQGWQHPAPGFNYFGIKGSHPVTGANTGPVETWEDYGNGPVKITDTFRAYDSPADSYRDFFAFLQANRRYAGALAAFAETGNAAQLIRDIKAAGYATDPAWPDKILILAHTVRAILAEE